MIRDLTIADIWHIIAAARWTIELAAVSMVGGSIIGLVIALMRTSRNRWLWMPALAFIRSNQGIPLLVQLFIVFFGAEVLGFGITAFTAATIALSFNAGAFLGDIWRGAIQAVPKGQWEAARALRIGMIDTLRYIVLIQALRIAIPPTVGYLVHHIKSTSLAAIIGYVELARTAHLTNATTFSPLLIFGCVALVYFAICCPLSLLSRNLEARLSKAHTS